MKNRGFSRAYVSGLHNHRPTEDEDDYAVRTDHNADIEEVIRFLESLADLKPEWLSSSPPGPSAEIRPSCAWFD